MLYMEFDPKYGMQTGLLAKIVLLEHKSVPERIPEPEVTDSGIISCANLAKGDSVVALWR